MPREILGGNSPRRAKKHKRAMREKPGPNASTTKTDWLEKDYAVVRDAAVSLGVFKVGMTKEDLVDSILEA